MTCDIIPSHQIAAWLLAWIDRLLDAVGTENGTVLEEITYTVIVTALAMGTGWLLRWCIVLAARHTPLLKRFKAGRELIKQRVITRCSHIIPPLLFLSLIPFAFDNSGKALEVIRRITIVYLLITMGVGMTSIMFFMWTQYNRRQNTKNLPLRGVLNVGRGVVWIIVSIVSVSVIIDKSPTVLLTGLGAFAAAVMLIFKDSILGFIAGVQISQNDMLRVGDWIIVPGTIADGIVTDVTLTAVKIRNWDNTIITLPPYTLVSTSFQNWRGMNDAGARLISRSVPIDNSGVKNLSLTMLQEIESATGLTFSGRAESNLGLLREYITTYLRQMPEIDHTRIIMSRLLQGDAYGTPLQVYCFCASTEWTIYESVQSKIVEHIMMICPTFHLQVADCNMVTTNV